jgi:hypothetical protein
MTYSIGSLHRLVPEGGVVRAGYAQRHLGRRPGVEAGLPAAHVRGGHQAQLVLGERRQLDEDGLGAERVWPVLEEQAQAAGRPGVLVDDLDPPDLDAGERSPERVRQPSGRDILGPVRDAFGMGQVPSSGSRSRWSST